MDQFELANVLDTAFSGVSRSGLSISVVCKPELAAVVIAGMHGGFTQWWLIEWLR
jgi:hypothetical protein